MLSFRLCCFVAKFIRTLGFSEWWMCNGLNLKSPTALAHNRRIMLSFETYKPGIDFSSLAMKMVDDIFFQHKAILPPLKFYYLACMCTCSVALFVILWTLARQAPLSWDFSGKNTGLPFPPPGYLPNSGIELISCFSYIGRQILYHSEPTGKPIT